MMELIEMQHDKNACKVSTVIFRGTESSVEYT